MKLQLFFIYVFCILSFTSCKEDNDIINNNPYLPNYGFEYVINTNFPQFNVLNFPSNGVFIDAPGVGIRGIIVFNTGNNNFVAYDAACPNQPLADCSTMILSGVTAKCPCDDAIYSLFTGLAPNKQYPMKPYRVQIIDANTLKVFN
jgi:nitrite reductase/ring-hydroxylating ferredoxin subunit